MYPTKSLAYEYHVGGSLPINAPSYIKRQADEDLYQALVSGEFCYVLNSRQAGKSSLRVRTIERLKTQGYACASIDVTATSGNNITIHQWVATIIRILTSSFLLSTKFNLHAWWRQWENISPVERLRKFLEEILLVEVNQPIVIFIEEIDNILTLNFDTDDFFGLIRDCYEQRTQKPEYNRLNFAVVGVQSPSCLNQDERRSPFAIGRAIELNGFQLDEAAPLAIGLVGKVSNPRAVLQEILQWTGGQPFLTQKLCQLICDALPGQSVEEVLRSQILDNWELQDQPAHLRPIRERLLFHPRLIELYQQILRQGEITCDGSEELLQLRLSGVVSKRDGKLRAYNPIYKEVFGQSWMISI
ncbi:MAG TPA: AAA-like domain-containing protein [Leptolyngbyaceae cyanobacterium]